MKRAKDLQNAKVGPAIHSEQADNHYSGRYLVSSMFNVEVPAAQRPTKAEYREPGSEVDDNVPRGVTFSQAPVMTDRSDAPTPYPSLTARFSLLYLNGVTLQCIGLAIGVALFSTLLQFSLQMVSDSAADTCVLSSGEVSMTELAAMVRNQTYSGVNATIWNMKQTAIFGIETTAVTYRSNVDTACVARNEAAANATHSMAQWTRNMMKDVENTTETLFGSLQDVGRALESSGYFNGSAGNLSSVFDIEIPVASLQTECGALLAGNVSNSSVVAAIQQVEVITSGAHGSLAAIMSKPLPRMNISQASNATEMSPDLDFGLTKPTRAWVIVFSIAAVIAMVPAGYKEYASWHYQLATEKELRTNPQFDVLERFYAGTHYGGTVLSEFISHGIISSGHHTRKVWVRWALNYSFSSRLCRLLQCGTFLAVLAIANSTLISSVKLPQSSTTDCTGWMQGNESLFTSFQKDINQDLFNLISHALEELDSNQLRLVNSLRGATHLDIPAYPPFGHGVGLEEAVLYPVSLLQVRSKSHADSTIATAVQDLSRNINSALWISSVTLFAIWALFAGCAFGWAAHKAKKTADSYGANSTPSNRI